MTGTTKPASPTSADRERPAGDIPRAVWDHARDLDDTVRFGVLVAVLSIVAFVLAGLVVVCATRPALPLYVFGG